MVICASRVWAQPIVLSLVLIIGCGREDGSDGALPVDDDGQTVASFRSLMAGPNPGGCNWTHDDCCPTGMTIRTLTNSSNVVASSLSECVVALGGDDVVSHAGVTLGGSGSDTIMSGAGGAVRGGEGADTINAFQGALVYGNNGNDTINAANGDNFVVPGAGADNVTAGVGADTVVIYDLCEVSSGERLDGGSGIDKLVAPVSKAALQALGVTPLCQEVWSHATSEFTGEGSRVKVCDNRNIHANKARS